MRLELKYYLTHYHKNKYMRRIFYYLHRRRSGIMNHIYLNNYELIYKYIG